MTIICVLSDFGRAASITTSEVVPLGHQACTKYKPRIDPSRLAPIEGEMATEICFTFLICLRCLCVCRYPHGFNLFCFVVIIFKENNISLCGCFTVHSYKCCSKECLRNMDLADVLICRKKHAMMSQLNQKQWILDYLWDHTNRNRFENSIFVSIQRFFSFCFCFYCNFFYFLRSRYK